MEKIVKPTAGNWNGCHDGDCACGSIFGMDGKVYIGTALGPIHIDKVDPVPSKERQQANARVFIHSKQAYLLLRYILKNESISNKTDKKIRKLIDRIEGRVKIKNRKVEKLNNALSKIINEHP